jgi:hypothetical protein
MIVGISTPHKQSGLLWDKYKAHFGKDGDVLVIQAASTLLNPTLPKSIIEQAMEDDPIAAAAELNAEWRSDIAGYVSMEVLEACTDGRIVVREPMAGVVYFAFVDSSSGSGRDSFCCGIAHVEGDRVVLDVAHEIRPPFNPSGAIKEICDRLRSRFFSAASIPSKARRIVCFLSSTAFRDAVCAARRQPKLNADYRRPVQLQRQTASLL